MVDGEGDEEVSIGDIVLENEERQEEVGVRIGVTRPPGGRDGPENGDREDEDEEEEEVKVSIKYGDVESEVSLDKLSKEKGIITEVFEEGINDLEVEAQ